MLKKILMYLIKNNDDTIKQFVINVLADKVANKM